LDESHALPIISSPAQPDTSAVGLRRVCSNMATRCVAWPGAGKNCWCGPWARDERIEVVEGDAGDEVGLTRAMRGCAAAYFLSIR